MSAMTDKKIIKNVLKQCTEKYNYFDVYWTYGDEEYTSDEMSVEIDNETEVGLDFVTSITETCMSLFMDTRDKED